MSIQYENLKFGENGLIPVITQDIVTNEVLMLAYANLNAIKKTIETGFAHYWSRSRKKLWMKGETSGNTQRVVRILTDCDNDTLIYMVKQKGVACHTGERTCFHREVWSIDEYRKNGRGVEDGGRQ
jgi:phosphoribosyl-AMP cyclohydrolase